MTVRIYDQDLKLVSCSKNLRGILDYSRKHRVIRVDQYPNHHDSGGQLGIEWADGATCITDFASFTVLLDWVYRRAHTRRGAFYHAKIINHG